MNKIYKKTIWILILILNHLNTNGCHESILTEKEVIFNSDGTYTHTFDVCMGLEDTYGFELVFYGAYGNHPTIITNPTTSITDPYTGVTMNITSNVGNTINYGEWNNTSAPLFHEEGVDAVCFNMSFTTDNFIAYARYHGTEETYGFCDTYNYFADTLCHASITIVDDKLTFCYGDTTKALNNSSSQYGIDLYEWSVESQIISTDSILITTLIPPGTQNLTLTVKDTVVGCEAEASVTLYSNAPKLNLSTDSILICASKDIEIIANVEMEFAAQSTCTLMLVMEDDWGDGWTNGFITIGSANGSNNYSATDYGLSSSHTYDTVYIQVTGNDSLEIFYSTGSYNQEVTFTFFDGDGNMLYTSSNPTNGFHTELNQICGNSVSTESEIKIEWTFNGSKTYADTFNAFVQTNSEIYIYAIDTTATFCEIWDTIPVLLDSIFVFAGIDTIVEVGLDYQMNGNIIGAYSDAFWIYYNLDGSITTLSNLNSTFYPHDSNTYYLFGISNSGCVYNDSVIILTYEVNDTVYKDSIIKDTIFKQINNPIVYIPTAFTPNEDGINDVWNITDFDQNDLNTLTIYNRWGNLIYYTNGANFIPWDGTFEGKPSPPGSYYFIITSELENIKGVITLIR